ncbi:hypothetical protein ATANTOWER_017606, partial [Ataeniobius toweri]|nr:hypothetical protein [Ataeniobius toweri]
NTILRAITLHATTKHTPMLQQLREGLGVYSLEYLQDFLYELEDAQPAENEETRTLTVPMVMQWMTGQAHKHLLLSERNYFKVTVIFDHNCLEHTPDHTVCYPVVSACNSTVTFPTAHLADYESFRSNLSTAVKYGITLVRL